MPFNQNIFALTCWNIDGLTTKINDDFFISKVAKYDIIGLIETWATDESKIVELVNNGLEEFNYIFVPAVGECTVGRKSGGIILLYKKALNSAIKLVSTDPNVIRVQLSANYFGWNDNMLLDTVYIPPSSSKYYTDQYTSLGNDIANLSTVVTSN